MQQDLGTCGQQMEETADRVHWLEHAAGNTGAKCCTVQLTPATVLVHTTDRHGVCLLHVCQSCALLTCSRAISCTQHTVATVHTLLGVALWPHCCSAPADQLLHSCVVQSKRGSLVFLSAVVVPKALFSHDQSTAIATHGWIAGLAWVWAAHHG